MTNAEKLCKNLEEMSNILSNDCDYCPLFQKENCMNGEGRFACNKEIKKWLKNEVANDKM